MAFDLPTILAEIKTITVGGLTQDQVDARVTAQVQPIIDKQAADEATLAAIQVAVTQNTQGVSDAETALQAIADQLAAVTPAVQPPVS